MPSTMSRPSCPADVADDHGSHAHVPEPYEDDAEITTDELARFIVELTDARGLTQRQQDRIEELTCSGTAAPTISLPNSLPRRLTTPTFQLVAARRAVAAHPDPELVGKGGSPLGNWPKFSKVSSTRRPERPSPEGGPCATLRLAQPHCTTWYHPDLLEPSRKHGGKFPCSHSRTNSIRDASSSFFEGSWESAAAGGAVSPHPHKSCLMPRPLSCNAGNRVSTPRSRAGQATRDAVRIPRRQ